MNKPLLLLVAILSLAIFAKADTVDFAFTNTVFWGTQTWKSSFETHEGKTESCVVNFKGASKQASTIKDIPVILKTDVTMRLITGKTLSHIEFVLRQWSRDTQTATLSYSKDAVNFTQLDGVSLGSDFKISSDLPSGTIAVRLSTTTSGKKVGVERMNYTVSDDPMDISVTKGFLKAVNVDALYDGCKAMIVNSSKTKTISSSQSGTEFYRNATDVLVCGDVLLSEDFKSAMAVFRVNRNAEGQYSFYGDNVTGGYIQASSSEKDYMITSPQPAFAAVEIDGGGVADIRFDGGFTHNKLRFDPARNIFSCFEDGQEDVMIFVFPEPEAIHPEINGATVTGEYNLASGATVVLRFPVTEDCNVYQRFIPSEDGENAETVDFAKYRNSDIKLSRPGILEYYTEDKGMLAKGLSINSRIHTLAVNSGSSGITAIDCPETEAVYYNLQGIKVKDPANGIFIRVSGGKASKVVL